MKKWLTRALIVVLILMFGGAAAIAYALHRAQERMERRIDIAAYDVDIPTAPTPSSAASTCSARAAASTAMAPTGRPRLRRRRQRARQGAEHQPGPGNVVAKYTPADWERSLRHGVKPDGRPLMIMPSEDYNRLSDADLGALVAYVKQLPPAAGGAAELVLPLPYRALYGLGKIPDAASIIDHTAQARGAGGRGSATVAHGDYVSAMCIGCHGEGLSGGKIPTGPPDWPAAPNLTPGEGSVLPRYADGAGAGGDAAPGQAARRHGDRGDALRFAEEHQRHRRRRAAPVPEEPAAAAGGWALISARPCGTASSAPAGRPRAAPPAPARRWPST